jgi:UDP-N-acetylglucosamine--N-acetylmuramyl-(pentapeptide) pyrophosphoryl-undecaprenol N-acetylglucosamine transferase
MKFMFACGGTAGHIYPAISVADKLKTIFPEAEFLFVGVEDGMETELVPREGYPIETLLVSSVRRSLSPKALAYTARSIYRTARAEQKMRRVIKEFKPNAVIGTGGYVCYPVIKAAFKLGAATLIHESNVLPGLTTRMLEPYCNKIMVGFEESKNHYKHPESISVTGTPVRAGFSVFTSEEAKRKLAYPTDKPVVLSFWGSLGASKMNEYTAELIARNEREGLFTHVHATGGGEAELNRVKALLRDMGVGELKNTVLLPFLYDMPLQMAAADLVMCRSGASTLAELTYTGKPSIQIPSANVTNNHQEYNARALEKCGAALVITEKECSAERMYGDILKIISSGDKLDAMSQAMKSAAKPDAVDNICSEILSLLAK